MSDLQARDDDVDPFGDAESHGAECIVGVHEGVHREVHGDEPAAGRCLVLHRVPGVDEHGGVVVPVQEDELLFAQDDEERVDEFDDFGECEEPCPAACYAHAVVLHAYCVFDAFLEF